MGYDLGMYFVCLVSKIGSHLQSLKFTLVGNICKIRNIGEMGNSGLMGNFSIMGQDKLDMTNLSESALVPPAFFRSLAPQVGVSM